MVGGCSGGPAGVYDIHFDAFMNEAMLFMDVFENPTTVKIVDPVAGEVRIADLSSFTRDEAVQLAKLLRLSYSGGYSASGYPELFYKEIKRLGGF